MSSFAAAIARGLINYDLSVNSCPLMVTRYRGVILAAMYQFQPTEGHLFLSCFPFRCH